MIPVLDGDVPVVVQANDVRQIQDAVTWAEEEGGRLVILGGYDAPYLAEQLVEKGLPILLTGLLSDPQRSWEPYDAWDGLPARLLGIADRVGSLEVGEDATLIITTCSPLEYATEVGERISRAVKWIWTTSIDSFTGSTGRG